MTPVDEVGRWTRSVGIPMFDPDVILRSATSPAFAKRPVAPPCNARRIHYSGDMDNVEAIGALAALAQTTRLGTFRLLVSREPGGIPAGELARLIAIPQNTMSTHLSILSRAGLVRGERQSRTIVYRADLERFRAITLFLLKDCCGGRPDICAPLIADLTPCWPPEVSTDD